MIEAEGEDGNESEGDVSDLDELEGNTEDDTWDEAPTVTPSPSKIERNVCGAQSRNLFSIAKRDPKKKFAFDSY